MMLNDIEAMLIQSCVPAGIALLLNISGLSAASFVLKNIHAAKPKNDQIIPNSHLSANYICLIDSNLK